MKLKKFLAGFAAAALMLSAGATTAFASDGWTGRYYLDADGDGVCDHMRSVCRYVDADGDGVCDRCGQTGWGAGCTDADGDGICDFFAWSLCSGQRGCGSSGAGRGYGCGHGCRRGC